MNKPFIASLVIIFSLIVSNAYSFTNNRHQWWQINLDNLQKEKSRLIKNKQLDESLVKLIDKEIQSARGIIDIFESKNRDDGSLSHETKTYTPLELKTRIEKRFAAFFPVIYLDSCITHINNKENLELAGNLVKASITKQLNAISNQRHDELISTIMIKDIGQAELNQLATEIYMERVINSYQLVRKKLQADLLARINTALGLINFSSNDKALRDLVDESIRNLTSDLAIYDLLSKDSDLLLSPGLFQKINSRISNNIKMYHDIIRYTGKYADLPLITVRYLAEQPYKLDELLFRLMKKDYNSFAKWPSVTRKENAVSSNNIIIPEMPDFNLLLQKIDAARNHNLTGINGKKTESFFNAFNNKLDLIIQDHVKETENSFFREKEKIELLKNKKNRLASIPGIKDFNQARDFFNRNMAKVISYKEQSLSFLRWLNQIKQVNSKAICEFHHNHMRRNQQYADFFHDLIKESVSSASGKNQEEHLLLNKSIMHISALFNNLSKVASINRDDMSHLPDAAIVQLKDKGKSHSLYLRLVKIKIKKLAAQYSALRNKIQKKRVVSDIHLSKTIAQHEVYLLLQNAKMLAELFDKMRYTEEVFSDYSLVFFAFHKQALQGTVSEEFNYAIKMKTLFSAIKNFNKEAFQSEIKTKRYTYQKTIIALSRLKTILHYYKIQKIELEDSPSPLEINAIEEKLKRRPSIKVADWHMNENNFHSIDLKIIKTLASCRSRALWKKKTDNFDDNSLYVKLSDLNMTLQIPLGWEEKKLGETDKHKNIIKSFSSHDKNAIIEIIKIPLRDSTARSIANEWLKSSGNKPVKQRWGKKTKLDYFWIIGRDKDKQIRETYAFSHNGYAVIISGRSLKNNYGLFKNKLGAVFNSITF